MHTTITINGRAGSAFLTQLARCAGPLPAPLEYLVQQDVASVEVDTDVAEQIAELVATLRSPHDLEPPLLFSPNVGDGISIVRDALLEFQPPAKRAPRIWRFVPRGTRGRLIAHEGDTERVLLEPSREVAFVRTTSMTCARFLAAR